MRKSRTLSGHRAISAEMYLQSVTETWHLRCALAVTIRDQAQATDRINSSWLKHREGNDPQLFTRYRHTDGHRVTFE